MKPTSENILNISKQPNDFCQYIDKSLEQYNLINVYSDFIQKGIEDKNTITTFEKCPVIHNEYQSFYNLINEMKSWFSDWLNCFKAAINKETEELFKNKLKSEFFLMEAQYKIFVNESEYFLKLFKEDLVGLIEDISYFNEELLKYNDSVLNNLHSTDHKSFFIQELHLNSTSFDLEFKCYHLSKHLEHLRDSASSIRYFTNYNLKIKTKIQLTRIKHDKWIYFIDNNKRTCDPDYHYLARQEQIHSVNN